MVRYGKIEGAVFTPPSRPSQAVVAAELIEISERIAACRDPTDDKFLEPAVNGKADMIVSGEADLLAFNPFRDIPIVRRQPSCRAAAPERTGAGVGEHCNSFASGLDQGLPE